MNIIHSRPSSFIASLLLTVTCASAQVYDLSKDFSVSENPSGVWSFGWKNNAADPLHIYTAPETAGPINNWHTPQFGFISAVSINSSDTTIVSDGGNFVAAPGRTWINPGAPGSPDVFGAIRFTAPEAGTYRVESAVESLFVGYASEDADYHVVLNGEEVFGVVLPPSRTTTNTSGYTNTFTLSAGSTLEFLGGPGPDGSFEGSGVKIALRIVREVTMEDRLDAVAGAIDALSGRLGNLRPLHASLNAASAAIEAGRYAEALGPLHALANKVRAQVARLDPSAAGELSVLIDALIDELEAASQPAN